MARTAPKSRPKTRTKHSVVFTWLQRNQGPVAAWSLILLGFATRFFLFGYPNQTVFDEVYFGRFVGNYFTGNYFFDIHPPFGKLLIAGFAKLLGYNPTSSFASIGTVFNDNGYLILRFLPSIAGMLLPVIVYGIARELGLKNRTAFLAGLAIVFENALLAQSRFVLIDSLLLMFGFASLWLYLVWRRRKQWWLIVLAAASAGMAGSIKWTALIFIVLPLFIEIVRWPGWRRLIKVSAVYLVIPLVLYVSFFAIHLTILDKTGDGDVFMSTRFQATLQGSSYQNTGQPPITLWGKIIEANREMYAANARLTAGHPYGSKWYTWPFMLRPISYWVQGNAAIWLIGNPLVWWGSTAGVIALFLLVVTRKLNLVELDAALIVLIGFAISWLPFATISRVMFLYHYLIPLTFAVLATAVVINRFSLKAQSVIAVLIGLCFVLFAPASYGIGISQQILNLRMWLPTWRS